MQIIRKIQGMARIPCDSGSCSTFFFFYPLARFLGSVKSMKMPICRTIKTLLWDFTFFLFLRNENTKVNLHVENIKSSICLRKLFFSTHLIGRHPDGEISPEQLENLLLETFPRAFRLSDVFILKLRQNCY